MDDSVREGAKLRKIKDIDPQSDTRIRIIGTVIDKGGDSIILDDGSGKTEVFLNTEDMDKVKEEQRIRVFGRVLPTPDSFELQAEVVQDVQDLNLKLYNKVNRELSTLELEED